MVGDLQTAALVGADGSVDWLCFPRFDSPACFAALLGEEANGRWRIAPPSGGRCKRRRYIENTLVLETEWETSGGAVRVVDCMPPRGVAPDLVRVIEGIRGKVAVTSKLRIRFDYGHVAPWITIEGREVHAVAGPDALWLRASAPHEELGGEILSRFTISEGERVPLVLTWSHSYGERPVAIDGLQAVDDTERFWLEWAGGIGYEGRFQDALYRSLLTLKGLTYEPSGGIVAAATTSLPETLGGSRNWDYRYCWLRDSTFTQAYGSRALDACALLIPRVGFLPYDDERVISTVETIRNELTEDGLVLRYRTDQSDDGLAGREGSFLICSFWMVYALLGIGRHRDAEELFGRLLALRNDVGLLSEEYDTRAQRLVGNFPQAFTHLALVNCALRLSDGEVSSAARE